MKLGWVGVAILGSWAGVASANTASPVSIEIVAPDGHGFREIPVDSRDGALRSYLQAERGARYQVRVRNTSGERLGLVIAVDGRNIINGRKSELTRDEPMYVLDAWDTQDYAGWRASLDAINEFYFTDWKDSYAEAFGDRSARGVIAVAAYREKASAVAGAQDQAAAPAVEKTAEASREAGTGYGDRRTEYVTQVEFEAESRASQRVFLKYEWRETLCSKHILSCEDAPNRFWPSTYGFAPPPPGR